MVAKGERAKAMAEGLTYYFTGQPCSRGHIAKRITANGICHDCFLEDKQKRRASKPGYRTRAEIDAETAKPMRKCSACGNEFPATAEHFVPLKKKQPSGTMTYGLSRECRTCRNKRFKPFYNKNRKRLIEESTARTKAFRQTPEGQEKNREWSREGKRRQLSDPIERAKHNTRGREWRDANPDKVKLFKHNQPAMRRYRAMMRYACRLRATPPWLDKAQKEQIKAIYAIAVFLTEKTGIMHHVDHVYPLVHERCSGLHVPWNLRVVTWEYNQSKGNKLPDELPPPTLLPISNHARELIGQLGGL